VVFERWSLGRSIYIYHYEDLIIPFPLLPIIQSSSFKNFDTKYFEWKFKLILWVISKIFNPFWKCLQIHIFWLLKLNCFIVDQLLMVDIDTLSCSLKIYPSVVDHTCIIYLITPSYSLCAKTRVCSSYINYKSIHDIQMYYQCIMYPGTHHCPLNHQQW